MQLLIERVIARLGGEGHGEKVEQVFRDEIGTIERNEVT